MGESKQSKLELTEKKFQELIHSDDYEMRNLAMSLVGSLSNKELLELFLKSGFKQIGSSYSGSWIEMMLDDTHELYKVDLEKREIYKVQIMGGWNNVFVKDPSKLLKLMPRKSTIINDDPTTIGNY